MKCLLSVLLLVSALAVSGLAQNSEQAEKPWQSPDGKWEYRLVASENDDSVDPTPAIVNTETDDVAVKLPYEGVPSFSEEEVNFVWSADSKHFAFNYRAGSRYVTTALYELRSGRWKQLRSPEKEASHTLEKAKAAQIREAKLPADIYQRRIWDTFRVIKWPDPRTALLYAYSIRAVPASEEDTSDIEAYYLFTLKFDGNEHWRIVNAKKLSAEEREKIPPMKGE